MTSRTVSRSCKRPSRRQKNLIIQGFLIVDTLRYKLLYALDLVDVRGNVFAPSTAFEPLRGSRLGRCWLLPLGSDGCSPFGRASSPVTSHVIFGVTFDRTRMY